MTSNLPDDWNSWRTRCGRCNGYSHPSGTEDCNCAVCVECSDVLEDEFGEGAEVSPWPEGGDPTCVGCGAEECEGCGEMFEVGTLSVNRDCAACVAREEVK